MSYPWFMFTVWFADGYDGVYQASGLTVMEAMKELLNGFEENPELRPDLKAHGEVVKLQFEEEQSRQADAAQRAEEWAAETARSIQRDINRILRKEDLK